jgi:hypothetical protein
MACVSSESAGAESVPNRRATAAWVACLADWSVLRPRGVRDSDTLRRSLELARRPSNLRLTSTSTILDVAGKERSRCALIAEREAPSLRLRNARVRNWIMESGVGWFSRIWPRMKRMMDGTLASSSRAQVSADLRTLVSFRNYCTC